MAGRPSPIDTIIGHRTNGDPITVAERITDSLRVGTPFAHACAAAGIHRETGYEWRRIAGRLRLRARGNDPAKLTPKATPHELRCLAFSDAVEESDALWHVGVLEELDRAGRGGGQRIVIVEKVDGSRTEPDGSHPVLERTTRTETLAPDARVRFWQLEHRFPDLYGRRVEVTGADGGPVAISVEDRRAALADTLAAYLQGADDEKRATRKPRSNGSNGAGVAGPA